MLKFISGSTQLVALGVVLLAVIVTIMAVNWAKLITDVCKSEKMVLLVLIVFISIGVVCVFGLLIFRICHKRSVEIHTTQITFFRIKLISMYIFGLGFLFHCGLYIWKHATQNTCDTSYLGIAYNSLSIIYTFNLFIYFALFYIRKDESSSLEGILSLGILLANLCIWLDTLFSESDFLFKNHNDSSHEHTRAIEAIEKTDPFLSPAIIEFSLMAINMLFTTTDDCTDISTNMTNRVIQNESNNNRSTSTDQHPSPCSCSKQNCYACLGLFVKTAGQVLIFLFSFALFAITFTVLVTTDSSKNLIDYSDDFTVYVIIQFAMKFIMVVFIFMCICIAWTSFSFHFNVSAFVLLITCFGNVVYHVLYCFALHHENKINDTLSGNNINQTSFNSSKSKNEDGTNIAIYFSWSDNIISISLAGLQTMFLLGSHSLKTLENKICFSALEKNSCCNPSKEYCTTKLKQFLMYYACYILGVLNLGLWISDSIGEERLPVFSISIYRAFNVVVWSVINKIILPLTIFFRFHSGLHFLEISWKYKYIENRTVICRNNNETTM